MQDIVGANCGCGSDAFDSGATERRGNDGDDRDATLDRCDRCGAELAARTYYGGVEVLVCPTCS